LLKTIHIRCYTTQKPPPCYHNREVEKIKAENIYMKSSTAKIGAES
jgi:hypothetical protein